jgi:hypothetical protein
LTVEVRKGAQRTEPFATIAVGYERPSQTFSAHRVDTPGCAHPELLPRSATYFDNPSVEDNPLAARFVARELAARHGVFAY